VNDSIKRLGHLALLNHLEDVPATITAKTTTHFFVNKNFADLEKDTSVEITVDAPTAANLTNLVNKVKLPDCRLPSTDSTVTTRISVYDCVDTGTDTGTKVTKCLEVEATDDNDNTISLPSYNCNNTTGGTTRRLSSDSCIEITFGLYDSEELTELGIAEWASGDSEEYSFECKGLTGSEWSGVGFDQLLTWVSIENKTAYCCATE